MPDGGGDPALQVGNWARVDGSPGAGTWDIVATAMLGGRPGAVANNAASITVNLPYDPPVGGFLGVVVGTRDSTARDPQTPTGYTQVVSATGAGKVVLYGRTVDGTEGSSVTITFAGGGAAGTDQLAFAFAVADFLEVGAIGAASSWLSADNLGPITGLTPEVADSTILLIGFKQNDFAGTSPPATATGWQLAQFRESTFGNDAGMVLLWQEQVGGPTPIPDATIIDTGVTDSAGAGVGFMVELKRLQAPLGRCRHRTPSGLRDWNHYVVKDIPDIGGDGITDYMVEGIYNFRSEEAEFCGVLARHNDDPAQETGYEWNCLPPLINQPGTALLQLYHIWQDTYTVLRAVTVPSIAFGEDFKLRMCIEGSPFAVQFKCYVNDVLIIPDDGTLDPLGIFEHTPPSGQEIVGGWPGGCLNDGTDERAGIGIELIQWRVGSTCEDTPCSGPPSNPYPTNPPPPSAPPTGIRVMQIGQWRDVISMLPKAVGTLRAVLGGAVMALGVRRPIYVFDGETIPEPDTPEPPFHDPCFLVPPLDAGPVLPLVGRFFGPSNTPIGALGPLFTGTQKALGGWYTTDLPEAVSRGAVLVGAQGGSTGIKLAGNIWDLTTFINGTRAKIAPLYALLLSHTGSGGFFGYSMCDDFESKTLWRPNGIPLNELVIAINTIRSEFPGIRLGARMRPSQTAVDPGFDFYTAQYTSERGPAFGWAANEYGLALARNAFIILSLNYLHGGDGSSGFRYLNGTIKGQSDNNWECSAAEVASYFTNMYAGAQSVDSSAAKLAGSLGYQYDPTFLTRPGMIDAFIIARNALAALPAP